eukprot:CAMPEP_0196587858 /NCGR_PEP_ID=MMETSP1081-20130531/58834_1 /TAXON_ID=36882 /ORGANISM="Pyramimonas amylifera, Strain CCMP720" /LENGTH=205 /DNA_ID=CAMNT_0041910173 /DNA_START=90 /DNA_END=707 /DNA_ORIENTATION=+
MNTLQNISNGYNCTGTRSFAKKISLEEYENQSSELTKKMLLDLNESVRADPQTAKGSKFFSNKENILRGLPIYEGKHKRFVYEDETLVGEDAVEDSRIRVGLSGDTLILEEQEENEEGVLSEAGCAVVGICGSEDLQFTEDDEDSLYEDEECVYSLEEEEDSLAEEETETLKNFILSKTLQSLHMNDISPEIENSHVRFNDENED